MKAFQMLIFAAMLVFSGCGEEDEQPAGKIPQPKAVKSQNRL